MSLDVPLPGFRDALREGRLAYDARQSRGDLVRVAPGQEQAGASILHQLARPARVVRDDWHPGRERFEHRVRAALVLAEHERDAELTDALGRIESGAVEEDAHAELVADRLEERRRIG